MRHRWETECGSPRPRMRTLCQRANEAQSRPNLFPEKGTGGSFAQFLLVYHIVKRISMENSGSVPRFPHRRPRRNGAHRRRMKNGLKRREGRRFTIEKIYFKLEERI